MDDIINTREDTKEILKRLLEVASGDCDIEKELDRTLDDLDEIRLARDLKVAHRTRVNLRNGQVGCAYYEKKYGFSSKEAYEKWLEGWYGVDVTDWMMDYFGVWQHEEMLKTSAKVEVLNKIKNGLPKEEDYSKDPGDWDTETYKIAVDDFTYDIDNEIKEVEEKLDDTLHGSTEG